MPDLAALNSTIDDVIADVQEYTEQINPKADPGVLTVREADLRELLQCYFVTLINPPPFNKLSNAEAERLALLAEELGETVQAIGKILRHGYESRHPDGGSSNRQSLERELGDVRHSMQRMICTGDLNQNAIQERAEEKAVVAGYLHHQ